jgi:hypothetical protein
MKTKIIYYFIFFGACIEIKAQNVGVGLQTPTKGRLEVVGTGSTNATIAAFGTDGAGISLNGNAPNIGFNFYTDVLSITDRHMATGYAAKLSPHPTIRFKLDLNIYPFNNKDQATLSGKKVLDIYYNGAIGLGADVNQQLRLLVAKSTDFTNATVALQGSLYSTVINEGINENTYLNGGKVNSKLFLSDNVDLTSTKPFNEEVKLFGETNIGESANTNPLVSLEVKGALAFSNHQYYNTSTGSGFPMNGNTSFISISKTINQPYPSVAIEPPLFDGQILIVHGIDAIQIFYPAEGNGFTSPEAGEIRVFIGKGKVWDLLISSKY